MASKRNKDSVAIEELFQRARDDKKKEAKAERSSAAIGTTITKSGWCLRQGLTHVYRADQGRLAPLLEQYGLPTYYSCIKQASCRHEPTQQLKDPSNSFESLCRIIVGQFVSGASAQAAWKRLLEATEPDLTPAHVETLLKKKGGIEWLQKAVGTTKGKASAIADLARQFEEGNLSEDLLSKPRDSQKAEEDGAKEGEKDDDFIRQALLDVRGLGPWSVDMFLMFHLEWPNVLPLGDLGVRKGIAIVFGIQPPKGGGIPKAYIEKVRKRLEAFRPHWSVMTYYMWRAADTPIVTVDSSGSADAVASSDRKKPASSTKTKEKKEAKPKPAPKSKPSDKEPPSTPAAKRPRRSPRRVTPS